MPEYALLETEKHIELLEKKSGLERDKLFNLLNCLTENVQIVPAEEFSGCFSRALEILENIDLNDAPFLALALSTPNEGLWSGDKKLQNQTEIRIWTTTELKKMLEETWNR